MRGVQLPLPVSGGSGDTSAYAAPGHKQHKNMRRREKLNTAKRKKKHDANGQFEGGESIAWGDRDAVSGVESAAEAPSEGSTSASREKRAGGDSPDATLSKRFAALKGDGNSFAVLGEDMVE